MTILQLMRAFRQFSWNIVKFAKAPNKNDGVMLANNKT